MVDSRNAARLIVLKGGNEQKQQTTCRRRLIMVAFVVGFIVGFIAGRFFWPHTATTVNDTTPLPHYERKAEVAKKPFPVSRSKPVYTYEATAYTYTGNNTASGKWPTPSHTVAVDPNVIPMGSHLTINGVSGYIAEDTGGDIQGYRVDIFMSTTAEALDFGRRPVVVQVGE